MKCKVTLLSASLALLAVNTSWAEDESSLSSDAYYAIEEISVTADGATYADYPAAMSEDGGYIATYSFKAALSANIDIGLPFTFNRDCQFDDEICELEFYGSENEDDLSFENAYQAWRIAQSDADLGSYTQYMFANTLIDDSDQGEESPFWSSSSDGDEQSSDIKTTDVTDSLDAFGDRFVVGYASAPYSGGEREYARRAYIKSASGGVVTELMPDTFDDDNGGFSSAFKLQEVTYSSSEEGAQEISKVLVVGSASRSYPGDDDDYFEICYNTSEDDDVFDVNNLVYCPGFDTQAWAWDITDMTEGEAQTGFALATTWLEGNELNEDSLTFSANAFDINASGTAVGASTFAYFTSAEGGRQRAIIMTPTYNSESGDYEYGSPVTITAATNDIEDQDDLIYNTWALTISDDGLVVGNREYATSKGVNEPIEFFVYDSTTEDIKFPLDDLKVATTEQRLENDSYFVTKVGANSRAHDANEDGLIVGEVDDYDQIDPVSNGSPRSQAAFLYDNDNDETWLINDLICSQDTAGVVTSPLYRIQSARVINDEGVVLAEGFKYDSNDDYNNRVNATQVSIKLTPNAEMTSPNDSPNCWESDLYSDTEESFERAGGAPGWLMLLALPLLFIRRFKR